MVYSEEWHIGLHRKHTTDPQRDGAHGNPKSVRPATGQMEQFM